MKSALLLCIGTLVVVSCSSTPKLGRDLVLPKGEMLHEDVPTRGILVGLPFGGVKLGLFVESAKRHLSTRYKDFAATERPAIWFSPASTNRCVTVLFSTRMGAPYWAASFDASGNIADYETGILRER